MENQTSQLIENAQKVEQIVHLLKNCTREEQIEKIFSDFDMKNPLDKRYLLEKTMGIQKVFNSPKRSKDPEKLYKQRLFSFINGNWRFMGV